MKITSIRIKGQRPSESALRTIATILDMQLARFGYITDVSVVTSTSIKVGLHMRSFRIDRTMHDRNLQHNPHSNPKLTDTPTWEQRVEFNQIVNRILNKFKASANVKSGVYTIRKGTHCMDESDWLDQKPDWIKHNESRGYYVEACDDESAFLEERRLARNRLARERRLAQKARENVLKIVQGGVV